MGRNKIFTSVVLSASNLSLRTDWFWVKRKATKDGRLSSSHHLTPFWWRFRWRRTRWWFHSSSKKCTITVIGNDNQDAVYWIKLSRARDQGLQFWQTRSHMQSSYTVLCQQTEHVKSNLSKRWSNIVRKTLKRHEPRRQVTLKSNWQFAAAAAAVSWWWCVD